MEEPNVAEIAGVQESMSNHFQGYRRAAVVGALEWVALLRGGDGRCRNSQAVLADVMSSAAALEENCGIVVFAGETGEGV